MLSKLLFILITLEITSLQTINALFKCEQEVQCECFENEITCVGAGFAQILIVSPFTTSLNLSHNQIVVIKANALRHLPRLNTLDLSYNRIGQLSDNVFAGLASLQRLYLHHNQISRVEHSTFKGLHELRELHLEHNSLLHLDGDVFFHFAQLIHLSILTKQDDKEIICQCHFARIRWNLKNNFDFCKNMHTKKLEKCGAFVTPKPVSLNKFKQVRKQKGKNQSKFSKKLKTTFKYEKTQNASKMDNYKMFPPIFTIVPESILRLKQNQRVVLECSAIGEPRPSMMWLEKSSKKLVSMVSTLIFDSISSQNQGVYQCIAQNKIGKALKEVTIHIVGNISDNSNLNQLRKKLDSIISAKLVKPEIAYEMTRNMSEFVDLVRLLMVYSDSGRQLSTVERPEEVSLSPVQQMLLSNFTGCASDTRFEVLECVHYLEQPSMSGICNNWAQPTWGSSNTPFLRLLPATYEDNLAKPVGWFGSQPHLKYIKPNPRKVTLELLVTSKITPDPRHNHLLMQFGQFLDHDLDFTAQSNNINLLENDLVDCRKTCEPVEPCYSIVHPGQSSVNCIEFKRSAEYCGTGYTSLVWGSVVAREQVNQVTAFLDASNIYGSDQDLTRHLREIEPNNGLLRSLQFNSRSYLPFNRDYFPIDCQLDPSVSLECFVAGDHRANEQIGLLVFHNLWFRQHNRLATKFRQIHPHWTGNIIFNEVRKIIIAQLQVITYRDWLPLILGKKGIEMLGEYEDYNKEVNAAIANVFATAAMRFGHTLVNRHLIQQHFHQGNRSASNMQIRDAFFVPQLLLRPGFPDAVLQGLGTTPLKKASSEETITEELTDHLFHSSRYEPLDLASINIQRGRDHGLPGYNKWRSFCGLTTAHTFEDLRSEISSDTVLSKLKRLYSHPDNIDLWVGGILEDRPDDAKVGPTFRCLLVNQFRRLRDGDRFFYQNPSLFSHEQLREIEKTTLAKVICENSDNFKRIPPNSFVLSQQQESVECSSLPDIDLTKWN